MLEIRNILFVSRRPEAEEPVLRWALGLARDNRARLSVLHACPLFPKAMDGYREMLLRSLRDELDALITAACDAIGLDRGELDVTIAIEATSSPAVHVVQESLAGGYDLLVKTAETDQDQPGSRAFDLQLLRKCACPVWLWRPTPAPASDERIGVAVDPDCRDPADHTFAVRLLGIAGELAAQRGCELAVISCWGLEMERYLRNRAMLRAEEVAGVLDSVRTDHRRALGDLIADADLSAVHRVHHLQGQPSRIIPSRVLELGVDTLVIGTVARTGVPGWLIGNTAETIAESIRCSLVVLKPAGFVSPMAPR